MGGGQPPDEGPGEGGGGGALGPDGVGGEDRAKGWGGGGGDAVLGHKMKQAEKKSVRAKA